MSHYNITSKTLRQFLWNGPLPGPLQVSVAEHFPGIEFRPIESINEFHSAAELVYQEYLKCQFILPHKNQRKISLFQILPTTITFVGIHTASQQVIGTMTVVEDSPLGLPMDPQNYDKLIGLRMGKRKLVEFSQLAINRLPSKSKAVEMTKQARLLLLLHLFRAAVDYLRIYTEVDTLVISYKSKHDAIYKLVAMEKLGGNMSVGKLEDQWALVRSNRFNDILTRGKHHAGLRLFFGDLPEKPPYEKRLQLSKYDIQNLFIDHSNILSSTTDQQLTTIQQHYPTTDLKELIQSKDLLDHLAEALDHQFTQDNKTI